MATTIKQAFREYKANLEITDRQATLVSERRAKVETVLGKKLTLHGSQRPKVTGSWDRNTLTRYLVEGDVDVMVILQYAAHEEWDSADGTIAALNRFRDILADAYPNTKVRRDRNCITMRFSEFRLDVVPAFRVKSADGTYHYKIPDSVRKEWVPTDPFEFAELISEVNEAMDEDFVPLIKMVKGWNRHVGWPIRSFHLEAMMYHHYKNYTTNYTFSSMLTRFFEHLPDYLRKACRDPSMRDRLDDYLDNDAEKTDREIAVEKAEAAAKAARAAYDLQEMDPEKAIRQWKKLLGEFFPAYG